jgi:hypothetical protein
MRGASRRLFAVETVFSVVKHIMFSYHEMAAVESTFPKPRFAAQDQAYRERRHPNATTKSPHPEPVEKHGNVCTGEGTTVLALAQLVVPTGQRALRIRSASQRRGEVRVSIGYPGRLADCYDIVPTVSLRAGLARLLRDRGQAVHTFRRSAASRPAMTR